MNNAALATTDATSADGVPFSREWTRRSVRLFRTLAKNPFVHQMRHDYGTLDGNGHGSVCANQALIELLNGLRNMEQSDALTAIDRILPVNHNELIEMNDEDDLSFSEIADAIEEAAGGQGALYA